MNRREKTNDLLYGTTFGNDSFFNQLDFFGKQKEQMIDPHFFCYT
jgi:hypothetical protein